METLCNIFFEFSNEDRLRILYTLKGASLTVTSLSRELGLTTQETSRHLSRLTEVGLTEKDPDGPYRLTPFGVLTLNQIQGLEFTSAHKDYFREHEVDGLPQSFLLQREEDKGIGFSSLTTIRILVIANECILIQLVKVGYT